MAVEWRNFPAFLPVPFVKKRWLALPSTSSSLQFPYSPQIFRPKTFSYFLCMLNAPPLSFQYDLITNKIYAVVIYSEIPSPLSHPLSLLQILHSATFTQRNKHKQHLLKL